MPDAYLDALRPEERAARYTFGAETPRAPATIVVVEDGAICGFATTGPARDADLAGHGELLALYVDPACWGRGVGATLVAAARASLAEHGFRGDRALGPPRQREGRATASRSEDRSRLPIP